ncbi:glutamate racemase [Variovorax arabinosiphilus]|uniref:glutamate racemase n=1 Tax=Variovorax arabinosiphilus TaxID=3053498 RepID=UPI0025751B08|nr:MULTISPECIES: glutamate racemase [unclassified Variovorax]MDM0119276.1 glutamate racemase [Variovorax sp. J2L1-78]MDM0129702.1 glutamate racemase [Variovorax sp. J2L1-63]MDM0232512.1 glutamate racemase [Variovorax sp. J2R1-6]
MNLQAIDPGLAASNGDRPIGVFDSGMGGLSVLAALRAELPHEDFVYFADTAYAPYGERGDAYVIERSLAVAEHLVREHRVKALVVACNTATTAAIHLLRAAHPALPIVGLEPGLKPAVAASRTGHIAVMATRGTLASAKYAALRAAVAGTADVRPVPCDGLVKAIEGFDTAGIASLCQRYMDEAGPFGEGAADVDTVVLGCTHYPLVIDELRTHAPTTLRFIDTGLPVAQHTRRLLAAAGQLAGDDAGNGTLRLESSGQVAALEAAATRWLALSTVA